MVIQQPLGKPGFILFLDRKKLTEQQNERAHKNSKLIQFCHGDGFGQVKTAEHGFLAIGSSTNKISNNIFHLKKKNPLDSNGDVSFFYDQSAFCLVGMAQEGT